MRTLITGLNGFTGRYVQIALEKRGHQVVGLSSNLMDQRAVLSELSILQPDCVVHLAAVSFVAHKNINHMYEVNLIGTRNLLHAISQLEIPVNQVLLTSSASIYGNASEEILHEGAPPSPENDYAVSKYAMELMANTWKKKLPITIVRPFNYTGLGQDDKFLIPKIVSHFKYKKKNIELGNLDVWREFNDVRFVADVYAKLAARPVVISETPINICTGKCYSLREILILCEKITDHSLKVNINSNFVRKNEIKVLRGDNNLLNKVVNSNNTFNIEKTLYWMLNNNFTVTQ